MPAAKPPELRRRAVDLARSGQQPVARVASDLGISESCLRRWMAQDDVDAGRREGVSSASAASSSSCAPQPGAGNGGRDPEAGVGLLCSEEGALNMSARLVQELADDGVPVAATCRVLGISRSGLYEAAGRAPSARAVADQALTATIAAIHHGSRSTYGAPRVHAELRLVLGVPCGRKRVARLMRAAGLVGACHRRKRRGQRPLPAPHEDFIQRRFTANAPDRLWCTDITEHPTETGKVYCAAALDVFTRKIVGWSTADHMRSELVVDALQMATWRRHHAPGAIVHADRGRQYTSWTFGHRLRQAGLLGSMGRVASSVDNTMMESFWSSMQRELLDRRTWSSREELASAIFEWVEGFYNPVRRHSGLGYRSPNDFEDLHTAAAAAA